METVLTVLIILLMVMALVMGAAVPAGIWFLKQGRDRRSTLIAFGICLLFFSAVLGRLFYRPVVMYAPECHGVMSAEQMEAVTSVSRGFYGHSAPVFAVEVSVKEVREDYVAWDIFYFPFGDIGMEYTEHPLWGGYNITRYLVN